jgi:hypothetical protein
VRVLVVLAFAGCIPEPGGFSAAAPAIGPSYTEFVDPMPVAIRGYTDSAMEPFITRDGAYLLFNNSNDPSVDTNLQLARRVDDLTFDYLGELTGADSSSLDGVPTVAADGALYFVSTRDYDNSLSTIYRASFAGETASSPALVPGVSRQQLLVVNFDVEVSADGNDLYFVDAGMNRDGVPQHADLVLATRDGDSFVRRPDSAEIFANVNSTALEYAAGISADELELFFTRVGAVTADARPTIYRAARTSIDEPFGVPEHVDAAEGFVEGPTLAPGGRVLYYHRCDGGTCSIYRVTRDGNFDGAGRD